MRIGRKTLISLIVVAALALTALAVVPALAANGAFSNRWGGMMGRGATNAETAACPRALSGAGSCLNGGPAVAEVTALLGMTQDEILAQLKEGKSLAQIAETKGVGKEQLVSTIVNARKTLLQQTVADGRLTQEQMDLMVQRMTERVGVMVDATEFGNGCAGRRGTVGRGLGRGAGGGCGGCGALGDPGTTAPSGISTQI